MDEILTADYGDRNTLSAQSMKLPVNVEALSQSPNETVDVTMDSR